MKPRNDLATCLVAAQAEAERLYGAGPVARWRPAPAWKSWLGVGLLVAGATLTLSWLWRASELPNIAAVADAGSAAASIATPTAEAPAATSAGRGDPGCGDSKCAATQSPRSVPAEPVAISPPWEGVDADAWALDPQSIVAPMAQAGAMAPRLHNTPAIADEPDATVDAAEDGAEQGGGSDE